MASFQHLWLFTPFQCFLEDFTPRTLQRTNTKRQILERGTGLLSEWMTAVKIKHNLADNRGAFSRSVRAMFFHIKQGEATIPKHKAWPLCLLHIFLYFNWSSELEKSFYKFTTSRLVETKRCMRSLIVLQKV